MRWVVGLLISLMTMSAFGAGTVVITKIKRPFQPGTPAVTIVRADWEADALASTIPDTNIALDGQVMKIVTDPGTPAPTANYDIALLDPQDTSLDLLAAAANNRHTTNAEQVYPAIAGAPGTVTSFQPLAGGTYTLRINGNTASAAKGRVLFYMRTP